MSLCDVSKLMLARGIEVSHEAIRLGRCGSAGVRPTIEAHAGGVLEPALLTLADGLVRVLDAVVLRQPRRWETVGITTAVAASLTSRSVTMAHGTLRSPFKRLLEPVLDDE